MIKHHGEHDSDTYYTQISQTHTWLLVSRCCTRNDGSSMNLTAAAFPSLLGFSTSNTTVGELKCHRGKLKQMLVN